MFLQNLQNAQYFNPNQKTEQYKVFNAQQIFNFLYENTSTNSKNIATSLSNGISEDNISIYISYCMAIITYMSEASPLEGSNFQSWTRFIVNIQNLIIDDEDDKQQKQCDFYKLAVIKNIQNLISLNMWCLDPSLAFKKLMQKNIYSIILTSGTLSPMESWQSELQIEFQIQLSNKHVIDITNNVRAFQHLSFDFSFKKRDDENQIRNLGLAILTFSQIIKGGIIVVFSSYGLMQDLRKRWANQQLIQRLNQVKKCLWEEQGSASFHNTLEVFKQNVQKGAILFAVHRGKVAEGIDLSDDLCRAVFLIGIPYPPLEDQKIKLKKEFLDYQLNKNQQGLSSKDWYNQQAVRATNQAVGRVIRHINDYGVIFLCDRRFSWSNMKTGISKWVQPAIQPWKTDNDIIQNLTKFFQGQNKEKNVSIHNQNQIYQEFERRNIVQETQKQVYQQFRQSSDIKPPNTIPSQQQQQQIQQQYEIQFKDQLIMNHQKQEKLLQEQSDQECEEISDQYQEDSSDQEMEEQSQNSEESQEESYNDNDELKEGDKLKKIKYNKSYLDSKNKSQQNKHKKI